MIKNKHISQKSGFTIVELLVVIIVIAILATVGFVQYIGMQDRAREAVLRSDLTAAAEILNIDQVRSGEYPESMDDADRGGGLPASPETEYQYSFDNSATPPTFCLTGINGPIALYITQEGVIGEGTCEGHHGPIAVGGDDEGDPGGSGPFAPVFSSFSAGGSYACGVAYGKVYCWGNGSNGKLGNGSTDSSSVPVAVSTAGVLAGKTVAKISVGANSACAVADGAVYCWGSGLYGKLGNGSTDSSSVPVAVSTAGVLAGKTVTDISVGGSSACAIADGSAYCWGQNILGGLGNGSRVDSSVPVAVSTSGVLAGKTVTDISAGQHACAVADGEAYCWGSGNSGRLGNGSTDSSSVPVAVSTSGVLAGKTVTKISTGGGFVCAVADGAPYCWGYGSTGSLGNGSTDNSSVPVAVSTSGVLAGKTVTDISSSGYNQVCVVANGAPYCWGSSGSKLGDGNGGGSYRLVPVAVVSSGALSGKEIVSVSVQTHTSCALDSDGSAYCWGLNEAGQFNNPTHTTNSSSVPVAVTGLLP